MMSLDRGFNWPEKEVLVFGNPWLRPTVPYAETISKRTEYKLKAYSFVFSRRLPSMMEMRKKPRKTNQRSKESWRRRWCER
jgi:hypothetical protein